MHIGSLCSGYGGLELGLIAVVGGTVAWHVENDKHPAAVLETRFPGVPNYGDITTTDWTTVEPVDWLTAGYPCQPFSHAGKRKGSADERHLWPAVADAIGVLRPGRVLLENVAGHLSLGLDAVLADLAALGYDATWGVVRAADAGAPHGRARVFIVAADTDGQRHERGRRARDGGAGPADDRRPATDTEGQRRAIVAQGDDATTLVCTGSRTGARTSSGRTPQGVGRLDSSAGVEWGAYAPAIRRWEHVTGRAAPRPTAAGRTGERLSPRFIEWLMGLPDGWVTDVLPRNPALKCLGNGVVPQQAALAARTLLNVGSVAA